MFLEEKNNVLMMKIGYFLKATNTELQVFPQIQIQYCLLFLL